jgi:hypothetical protein
MGNTRLGVVDLAAGVLTFWTAFFSDLSVAGLEAALSFGSGFSGHAIFWWQSQ